MALNSSISAIISALILARYSSSLVLGLDRLTFFGFLLEVSDFTKPKVRAPRRSPSLFFFELLDLFLLDVLDLENGDGLPVLSWETALS